MLHNQRYNKNKYHIQLQVNLKKQKFQHTKNSASVMVIMCLLTLSLSMFSVFFVSYFSNDLTLQVNNLNLLFYTFCLFYIFLVQISTILILHHHFFHVFSLICGIDQLALVLHGIYFILVRLHGSLFLASRILLLWIPLQRHPLVTFSLPFLYSSITPLSSICFLMLWEMINLVSTMDRQGRFPGIASRPFWLPSIDSDGLDNFLWY